MRIFGGDGLITLKGFRAGFGKRDAPEIGPPRNEVDADVTVAVLVPPCGDHASLNGLAGVLVHENERLAEKHLAVKKQQTAVLADCVRVGFNDEVFA